MERVKLFLKGVCMGVADVIPGVSGGTLALILGIYAELVNSIKGLHLLWIPTLWGLIRGGFQKKDREKLIAELSAMNLAFLVVLGCGIASAIAVAGLILPTLLERYPEVMRALFFGLIIASVGIPFKMISFKDRKTRIVVAGMCMAGVVFGWMATDPDRMLETGMTWKTIEAEADDTLKDISRRGPSAWPGEEVFWADENAPLRAALVEYHGAMDFSRPGEGLDRSSDAVRERSEAYEAVVVPAGTPVQIPQPAMWFIFLAGMITICAMILPGISGSYLLLIMGGYYFILNALKGVLMGMAGLALPPTATLYVALFMIGAGIGLLSFARVMSYLLKEFPAATLGLLVGLMIGCLRGIWPFRSVIDGTITNVLPTAMDSTVIAVGIAAIGGAALVTILSRLGRSHEEQKLEKKGR